MTTTNSDKRFAFLHIPSTKWAIFDTATRTISLVDTVYDYDCLYRAKNVIEDDFSLSETIDGLFVLTPELRKEFQLCEVYFSMTPITHNVYDRSVTTKPKERKTVALNTFGARETDNALVVFLNSLRENDHQSNRIQRRVMAFMHELNKDMFDLFLLNADFFRRRPFREFDDTSFIHRINELFLADCKKRLKNMNWREPLKCAVNACIMERYRHILKVETSPLINVNYRNTKSKK